MCEPTQSHEIETVSVEVNDRILKRNDRTAAHNREHFRDRGILCINLMGSPGAGKTAILEATAQALGDPRKLAAIAGDVATDRDAERLRAAGIRSIGVTTGNACHLDSEMIHRALHDFSLEGVEYLFIENVGNLVCPAVYDLGQNFNVVAFSVTEGEDKPLKYPVMFRKADLVLVTKFDLLDRLPQVQLVNIFDSLARVMPIPRTIITSRNGFGIAEWATWLQGQRAELTASMSQMVGV